MGDSIPHCPEREQIQTAFHLSLILVSSSGFARLLFLVESGASKAQCRILTAQYYIDVTLSTLR